MIFGKKMRSSLFYTDKNVNFYQFFVLWRGWNFLVSLLTLFPFIHSPLRFVKYNLFAF